MPSVRKIESMLVWLAWQLPRGLVYWCVVRAGVRATTGPWYDQVVPELTLVDTLRRWDTRRGGTSDRDVRGRAR